MGYLYAYAYLFVYFISFIKGELNIQIYRNVSGIHVPIVNNRIEERPGANLTLICKSTANDRLVWSRLENLVRGTNGAIKHFHQLFPFDSGTYVCSSLNYGLVKAVQLHVNPQFTPRKRRSPSFNCPSGTFVCASGETCIRYEYVCDSVKDCNDGSDENPALCGADVCFEKKRCPDGRCISELLCCDKGVNPDCPVEVKPSCCTYDDKQKPKLTFFQILWIVVICAIALVFVTMCLVLIQSRSKMATNVAPVRSRNNRRPRRTTQTTSFISSPNQGPPMYKQVILPSALRLA